MKTLVILRHGKSSWGYENISDIDRPLKNRGIRDGYDMASRLLEKNCIPDVVISSPATRALHTAIIFTRVLKVPLTSFFINEQLYFSDESEIVSYIKSTSDNYNNLLIVGHNPVFTSLANIFTKNEIDNIPTTGIVQLEFNVNAWKDVEKGNLHAEDFDFPKKD